MADDVAETVRRIIAEQAVLEPSQVTLESTTEELGLDSLGLVETVFAIEEAFDISIPFNANEPGSSEFDVRTVGSIVEAVKQLIADQNG